MDLPDPGIEPKSPALQADFSSAELPMKPMINLENVLKSRDITLPTKVHIDKAVVFPVIMYRCKNWTTERLSSEELMFLNYGVGEDS